MKPSNKTEVIKKEISFVKYGPYAGKKNKSVYKKGFARERNSKGVIHNRGILFRETKFPSGKKSSSMLSDSITAKTKSDAISKAKRMIKKNKW